MALTKSALAEAVALAAQIAAALQATIGGQSGTPGAELQFLCGAFVAAAAAELAASVPAEISSTPAPAATFWGDFTACFDQAQAAGASFVQFEAIRGAIGAVSPLTPAGAAVRNYAARMVLVEEARILAAMTFISRDQIDAYIDLINCSFDQAETAAADNLDNVAYQALIALHGAVVGDLSTRAIPLPQLVAVSFPVRLPALYLAQRVYQDAARADQIVAENAVVHPLFCPFALRVLSA